MNRNFTKIVATGLLVAGSVAGTAGVAGAHHKDGHTANNYGLCNAKANGGQAHAGGAEPDCENQEPRPDPDETAPTFTEATYADGVFTVTYSEPIMCEDVDPSDYEGTLVRDGETLGTEGADTATCEGETNTTVLLTADEGTTNAFQPGDVIIISATDDNDVQDAAGNEQPADDTVEATVPGEPADETAPTFKEATYSDGVVTVTYSEPILCEDVDPTDYEGTLVRDGQALGTEGAATATCEGDGATSTTVLLTADEGTTNALEPGDVLVITATEANDVQDAADNQQPTGDEVHATV